MQLLGVLDEGHRAGDALIAAAGVDDDRQLTAVHAGIRTGGRLGLGPDRHIVAVGRKQHPADVGTVVAQKAFFRDGVVVADLPLQQVGHIPQVGGLGKLPDILHVQKTAVRPAALLRRFVRQRLFVEHLAVLFDQADVGVEVRDAHLCPGIAAALGHNDIEHMALFDVLNGDGHRLQVIPDGSLLVRADLGDDLQLLLGRTGDDACGGRSFHALQVAGVGHDDAFHVLDDAAAHLQLHALGQHAQHLAGLRGGIGQRDGLGAAHCRDELLFQNPHIRLIARVAAFHILPSLSCYFNIYQ